MTIFRRRVPELARELANVRRFVSQTANLMCGVPDYATYVAHRRQCHPDEPIMSEDEFFRERQRARYADGSGRGMRCC
jgi:uncharacterized short protein YbdD (DUF466 family)